MSTAGSSRLNGPHESKLPLVSRIKFFRSKLTLFSAHVTGVTVGADRLLCGRTVAGGSVEREGHEGAEAGASDLMFLQTEAELDEEEWMFRILV